MLEPKQPLEDKMHNIMELFLGTQELPIYMPQPQPLPQPSKGIMEDAHLPVDLFLVYAEEGTGTAPTAIIIKK